MRSAALAAGVILGGVAASSAFAAPLAGPGVAPRVQASKGVFNVSVCGDPADGVSGHCHAHVVTDATGAPLEQNAGPGVAPKGFGPADLRAAYNITTNGKRATTVAVITAFGYKQAEADLAVYRAAFGLPPCTTSNGCFTRVGQDGGAPSNAGHGATGLGWEQEAALDLDMVSAMCPNCSLLLVQANSGSWNNLGGAVNTAANLGAAVINNSYGGDEKGTRSHAADYDHPGVAVVASTGDAGYGVQFPASLPYVIAVGGTSLVADPTTARGWTETAWAGTGSGCSALYSKPAWQADPLCAKRMVADVAAVADPYSGVAVYAPTSHTVSAWQVYGGTSVAAPLVSGIYGVNGVPGLYGSDPYLAPARALNDVTSGANGTCDPTPYFCTAGVGYDGPTGLGTPNGKRAF